MKRPIAVAAALLTGLCSAAIGVAAGSGDDARPEAPKASAAATKANAKAKAHAAARRGRRGRRGPIGPPGPRGPQGPEGPRGANGESTNAFYTQKTEGSVNLLDVPEFTYKDVLRLDGLPAGNYLITGNAVGAKRGGNVLVRCRIAAAGGFSTVSSASLVEASAFVENIVVTHPVKTTSAFDAVLQCAREYAADAQATYVESLRLHAIQVGNLDVRSVP